MNFDFWYRLLGPGGMLFFACAILAIGALLGWSARVRHRRRLTRGDSALEDSDPEPTLSEAEMASPAPAASEELVRDPPRMSREWDGGQPRPNWNRRSG